jgi:hypothetical protein
VCPAVVSTHPLIQIVRGEEIGTFVDEMTAALKSLHV